MLQFNRTWYYPLYSSIVPGIVHFKMQQLQCSGSVPRKALPSGKQNRAELALKLEGLEMEKNLFSDHFRSLKVKGDP